MLTKGEDVKKRLQLGDALIEQKDRVDKAILAAQVDYAKLERSLINPTDPEQQKGNGLQTSVFIKKLKHLIPNIHWLINPHYKDKCGIFLVKRQIASGEYPFMPEWSVLTETYELLPTTSPEHVLLKRATSVRYSGQVFQRCVRRPQVFVSHNVVGVPYSCA